MPKLSQIAHEEGTFIQVHGNIPWFSELANTKGLRKGAVYLVAGDPGVGKTTFALTLALERARQGYLVKYLTQGEMRLDAIKEMAQRLMRSFVQDTKIKVSARKAAYERLKPLERLIEESALQTYQQPIFERVDVDDKYKSIGDISDHWVDIARPNRDNPKNFDMIIVDSMQGFGLGSNERLVYKTLQSLINSLKN